jgi:hypothetical protein
MKNIKIKIIFFLLLIFSSSVFAEKVLILGAWTKHQDWVDITSTAIDEHGPALLENINDIENYCGSNFSNFSKEQKKGFWINLIGKLAELESSNNPKDHTREPDLSQDSYGLLQLSPDDSKKHSGCDVGTEEKLYQPKNNLTCGVIIMNSLIKKYGHIRNNENPKEGLGAYWAPFRTKNEQLVSAGKAYCKKINPSESGTSGNSNSDTQNSTNNGPSNTSQPSNSGGKKENLKKNNFQTPTGTSHFKEGAKPKQYQVGEGATTGIQNNSFYSGDNNAGARSRGGVVTKGGQQGIFLEDISNINNMASEFKNRSAGTSDKILQKYVS